MSSSLLCAAADKMADDCKKLNFSAPATHVYHPLIYARAAHHAYLNLATKSTAKHGKQALFLGINPGPWGMAQTGVPFGEVAAVRDWMKISAPISAPEISHPQRPVLGWQCTRSEVSGRRLWGLFSRRFPQAKDFFASYIVLNYCPLLFLTAQAATQNNRARVSNITPDKLQRNEQALLFAICDEFLQTAVRILRPKILIGIGGFAEKRLHTLFANENIGSILHPSPASPAANRGFDNAAIAQLRALDLDF